MQLNSHIVKMTIEVAQLLSTAHRVLDGKLEVKVLPDGKKQKLWLLEGETTVLESRLNTFSGKTVTKHFIDKPICYNLSHQNHPCAIWCRETSANYVWLFEHFKATAEEFTYRYGKEHKTWIDCKDFLSKSPLNIKQGSLTPFAQAMAEEFKDKDATIAYQNYYVGAKASFAIWTRRPVPTFFKERITNYDPTAHERTAA